jgi:hypothetical protein
MDVRFGTWNVRSLCRAGSLVTVSELSEHKSDFVGVQVRRATRRANYSEESLDAAVPNAANSNLTAISKLKWLYDREGSVRIIGK